jgi:hypothetical protein
MLRPPQRPQIGRSSKPPVSPYTQGEKTRENANKSVSEENTSGHEAGKAQLQRHRFALALR